MADRWDKYAVADAPTDKWDKYASSESQSEGSSALGDLIGGVADTTIKTIPAAAKMVYHAGQALTGYDAKPIIGDMKHVVQSHVDQYRKAVDAWKRGDRTEAVGHALATAIPLVGPAAASAGETIGGELKYGDEQHPDRPTGVVREPQVARGIGQGIGLAASVSPKNVIEPVTSGAARLVGKIPVPERLTPEGMYQSALRPGLSRKNLPKIDAKVKTGLTEEIPVDRSGLNKTDAAIDGLNTEITGDIAQKSAAMGPTINPVDVTKPVNRLKPTFANQVNPKADMADIGKAKSEFLDKHSDPFIGPLQPQVTQSGNAKITNYSPPRPKVKTPLTLDEAQAEKIGTYRQVRKKYGELASADIEAQKALARGLKDEIVKRVPEIAAKNAREGNLIELQSELERMVAREGNKNLLGLVPATMSHNPFGFLATIMMDNPAIKSRIAIMLNKARGNVGAAGIGQAAMPMGPLGVAGAAAEGKDDEPPKYAKGGTIHRPTLLSDLKTGKPTGIMAEAGPEAIVPLGSPDDPTAAHTTVPETPATLKAQIDQLSSGARRVVMFPAGTPLMKRPKGMQAYQDEHGNSYFFDPSAISTKDIDKAIASDDLPSILGAADGGMGAPDKSKLGSPVKAVVGIAPDGTSTQATATDPAHEPEALRQTAKVTPRGGSVRVEDPQQEIKRRIKFPALRSPAPVQ